MRRFFMRRHRQSPWSFTSLSIAISAAFGGTVVICFSAAMAGVTYLFLKEMIFVKYIAIIALILGGIASGWLCGKLRRRLGLKEGSLCGAALYVLTVALSLLLLSHIPSPAKLLLLAVSGALGGVWGVNSKRIGHG